MMVSFPMQYSIAWDPTLKKIQSAVVEAVSPDKIILFGSRARGQAALHSDYDLLVIKDDIQNERDRLQNQLQGRSKNPPFDGGF